MNSTTTDDALTRPSLVSEWGNWLASTPKMVSRFVPTHAWVLYGPDGVISAVGVALQMHGVEEHFLLRIPLVSHPELVEYFRRDGFLMNMGDWQPEDISPGALRYAWQHWMPPTLFGVEPAMHVDMELGATELDPFPEGTPLTILAVVELAQSLADAARILAGELRIASDNVVR